MVGKGLVKYLIILARLQFLPTLDLPSALSSKAARQAEPKITPTLSVPVPCRDTLFPQGNRLLLCKMTLQHTVNFPCSGQFIWHVLWIHTRTWD